jgi:2-iminobutanoate/2-iminopropanoate deaminase
MKTAINAKTAPEAIGPYVHGVAVGDFIFTSGQLGINTQTEELADGIEAQTRTSLKNLEAVLAAGGSDFNHVVKTTIYLLDMGDFAVVNSIYAEYFHGDVPARSCVGVANLPKGGLVEIEAIAIKA